jgi:hypothetical protein
MEIHWFDSKERSGQASFTQNYITLNSVASIPFEYAYRVKVGVDAEKNVVIEPLSKERVLRGDLDEYQLQSLSFKKSYTRIASTALMRAIAEETGLSFDRNTLSFPTSWDEKENLLTVKLTKGGK